MQARADVSRAGVTSRAPVTRATVTRATATRATASRAPAATRTDVTRAAAGTVTSRAAKAAVTSRATGTAASRVAATTTATARAAGAAGTGSATGTPSRGRRERGGDAEPVITEDDVLIPIAGILDVLDNYGFVRTTGYLPGPDDVYVSLSQVRRHGLRKGDVIEGAVRQPREGERREKFNALVRLDKINGLDPEQSKTPARSSPSSSRCTRRSGSGWRPTRPT